MEKPDTPTTPLSAVIITLNEEINIERCLRSLLPVADEIVVIDSGSTDGTVQLAKSYGARVIYHKFEGHIEQKNVALHQAAHPLILSLDADEALSDELTSSILRVKQEPKADCYAMNRLTNYCGRWIRHGGWYPDTKCRLIRKGSAAWGGINPHDELIPIRTARRQKLKGDLLHYSYYTINQHINQSANYAAIMARALAIQGRRGSGVRILFSPVIKFFRNYLFRGGFRDGYYGFVICRITAQTTFWKYVFLNELSRNKKIQ